MSQAEQLFNEKAKFNKWLTQLTETEKALVIEMMNDAFHSGYGEASSQAISEIHKNYAPNH